MDVAHRAGESLDLPLNLDQNRHNPFHSHLKELRSRARERARELAVSAQPVCRSDITS